MGTSLDITSDPAVETVQKTLIEGLAPHGIAPSDISVRRRNSISIRVRVIHPIFRDASAREKEKIILPVLQTLPEEIDQDIDLVMCLTPEDAKKSLVNQEFEKLTPSNGIV